MKKIIITLLITFSFLLSACITVTDIEEETTVKKEVVESEVIVEEKEENSEIETIEEIEYTAEIVEEYSYINTINDPYHFVVVRNTSSEYATITANDVAYNENGDMVSAKDDEEYGVAPNEEILLVFLHEMGTNPASYKCNVKAKENFVTHSAKDNVLIEQTINETTVVVSLTNNGTSDITSLDIYGIFFKDGKVISHDSRYRGSDEPLKPNETWVVSLEYYDGFDDSKIFVRAEKD